MDEIDQFFCMHHYSFVYMVTAPCWVVAVKIARYNQRRYSTRPTGMFLYRRVDLVKCGLHVSCVSDMVEIDRFDIHREDEQLPLSTPDFNRGDVGVVASDLSV